MIHSMHGCCELNSVFCIQLRFGLYYYIDTACISYYQALESGTRTLSSRTALFLHQFSAVLIRPVSLTGHSSVYTELTRITGIVVYLLFISLLVLTINIIVFIIFLQRIQLRPSTTQYRISPYTVVEILRVNIFAVISVYFSILFVYSRALSRVLCCREQLSPHCSSPSSLLSQGHR